MTEHWERAYTDCRICYYEAIAERDAARDEARKLMTCVDYGYYIATWGVSPADVCDRNPWLRDSVKRSTPPDAPSAPEDFRLYWENGFDQAAKVQCDACQEDHTSLRSHVESLDDRLHNLTRTVLEMQEAIVLLGSAPSDHRRIMDLLCRVKTLENRDAS